MNVLEKINQKNKVGAKKDLKKISLNAPLKIIDLFCGIGGFHIAASSLGHECVFASDIDVHARKAYTENFGIEPAGDITKIDPKTIPNHDILCAGFPCQPFSIIGSKKALEDSRGTLFYEIIKIIETKKPKAVFLENVKQLATINDGTVLKKITSELEKLDYKVFYKVLNALDYGLPQKRERIAIVAIRNYEGDFLWPSPFKNRLELSDILEETPEDKHFASKDIKQQRLSKHQSKFQPAIWHQNKSGNISSHPFSCALRAGASYNYLLVDGVRRLTPREMLRLQGFPDSFKIFCSDTQTRKQAGNSVPVPMIKAVMEKLIDVL